MQEAKFGQEHADYKSVKHYAPRRPGNRSDAMRWRLLHAPQRRRQASVATNA